MFGCSFGTWGPFVLPKLLKWSCSYQLISGHYFLGSKGQFANYIYYIVSKLVSNIKTYFPPGPNRNKSKTKPVRISFGRTALSGGPRRRSARTMCGRRLVKLHPIISLAWIVNVLQHHTCANWKAKLRFLGPNHSPCVGAFYWAQILKGRSYILLFHTLGNPYYHRKGLGAFWTRGGVHHTNHWTIRE